MAKVKKVVIDLDTITLEKGKLAEDEVNKIREAKFSGGKRPSIYALKLADEMLKNVKEGTFVKTAGMTDERKESVFDTLKKELQKVLKEKGKSKELRLRALDQGDKLTFFYDGKKAKQDKNSSKKGKAA